MEASKFSDAQKAFIIKQGKMGAGRGNLPEGRDQPSDLFQLEKEIRAMMPSEIRRRIRG